MYAYSLCNSEPCTEFMKEKLATLPEEHIINYLQAVSFNGKPTQRIVKLMKVNHFISSLLMRCLLITLVLFTIRNCLTSTLYSTLLYSTLLYSTLLYSTLLYSTLLCSALLCSALLYSTLLYSTLLYSTLLYSTLLYSTLLYSTLLYSTLLYSTLLYSELYLKVLLSYFAFPISAYFLSVLKLGRTCVCKIKGMPLMVGLRLKLKYFSNIEVGECKLGNNLAFKSRSF